MIEPGNRNNTLFEFGQRLKEEGKSFTEIESGLYRENQEKNNPPLPLGEVHAILCSLVSAK